MTLVIEGGAMRAVFASGVAWAIQRGGIEPDAIYGTSAGAAIAAWFAAGQMDVGVRTWDRASDRTIMSFRRLLSPTRAALDFAKLYAEIYPTEFGMDIATLRQRPYPVLATLSDADTGQAEYVDLRTAPNVWRVLHASSAMPFVSDSPVELDGRRFLDGGVIDPLPVERAIKDGHQELLVLANRPPGPRPPESAAAVELMRRTYPALAGPTRVRHETYDRAISLALSPPDGVHAHLIRPSGPTNVTRFTRDIGRLRAVLEQGRVAGEAWCRARADARAVA